MVIIVILLVLLLLLAGCYACFHMAFFVPRKKLNNPHVLIKGAQYQQYARETHALIDEALARPFEEVYIQSQDGLRLYGRYYETKKGAPVQIMMHGYQSIAIRDFSGGLLYALDSGYNVLLVDQRAHGKSAGKYLSFGIRERRDCLEWARYIVDRCGSETKIYLVGISMGAATVLMAADLSLPEQVRAIIADSGYSSPEAIIRKVIRDRHYPESIAYFLVSTGARIFGHLDLRESSALQSLKRVRIPVLFIHGEADHFVPCEMSRAMYEACVSDKKLLTVPNAGHGLGYMEDEKLYKKTIADFLASVK